MTLGWAGMSSPTNCGSSRQISTRSAVVITRCAAEQYSGLQERGATSCQYALFMLRWLHRAPEDFLTGADLEVGDVRLPEAGTGSRLRWDLNQLHTVLNEQRRLQNLTWADLAEELDCTPSRLTNLRTARLADMDLAMRITQWLRQPAAAFIHPAQW
ncbi:MAG: hypothetical protein WKF73_17885 [Nocardioidaceae bacterium]